MARKIYTEEEQAVIDARTNEVANKKRNSKLIVLGVALLIVGGGLYFLKK